MDNKVSDILKYFLEELLLLVGARKATVGNQTFLLLTGVYIANFIVEFCGMSLNYLFVTLMVVNRCWYYLTMCR